MPVGTRRRALPAHRPKSSIAAAIAILGAPCAGKSTLVEALEERVPIALFKLSCEAVSLAVEPDPRDQLGWLSEEDAARILFARLPALVAATEESLLVFENFPGSRRQARLLTHALAQADLALLAVDLEVPVRTLERRAAARCVCPRCGRAASSAEWCRCGVRRVRRIEDEPRLFRQRFERFVSRRPAVAGELEAGGCRVLVLDGRSEPGTIAETVLAAPAREPQAV